jgi:DNA-binding transcriptional LysR family regulator
MELRQIKMFCAVAEHGSFTAAAAAVYCVQSNVTMRIKELEAELGQPLFVRAKSGITLTTAGRTFQTYASRVLKLVDESRLALESNVSPCGSLKIGTMESTAAVRLPRVLMAYRSMYPQVRLSLVTGTTIELIRRVQNHELDGAFVGGFHDAQELNQEQVFEEELVLVSSRKYGNMENLRHDIGQMAILVFRTGCFYRSTFESWLHQAGLVGMEMLELGTLDGILSCVASGIGVSVLPISVVQQFREPDLLCMHTLPVKLSRVATVFVRRQDAFETAAMRSMIEVSHKYFSPALTPRAVLQAA